MPDAVIGQNVVIERAIVPSECDHSRWDRYSSFDDEIILVTKEM